MASLIPQNILNEIESWISKKKYGNISLNFAEGVIKSVRITESCMVKNLGDGTVGFISATISTSVPQDDDK